MKVFSSKIVSVALALLLGLVTSVAIFKATTVEVSRENVTDILDYRMAPVTAYGANCTSYADIWLVYERAGFPFWAERTNTDSINYCAGDEDSFGVWPLFHWQGIADWLIYSLFWLALLSFIRKKYAHTRH